jgi:hypothetical protein
MAFAAQAAADRSADWWISIFSKQGDKMSNSDTKEVFISYSNRGDADHAQLLRNLIESTGAILR